MQARRGFSRVVARAVIERVLGHVKIEDVVGAHVELKRSGASFKGNCPFHEETKPSFFVHPDRGMYYCFGCRKGGDAIRFLQEIEGKSFMEALVDLATRAGIEIPMEEMHRSGEAGDRDEARRKRHMDLLDSTAGLYERALRTHPEASRARDYLDRRGIGAETVKKFRLGFAPDRWDFLVEHLRSKGISPQDAAEVGLVRPRKQGQGWYDWFRGRIMFPISNAGGKIIGFSGRIMEPSTTGGDEAKYINSPETPYYRKGEIIYGLYQAASAVRKAGRVLLVEGNFDLVSMSQAGFENVVAPMGTALTAEQVSRLGRFGAELVFVFDGDRAGRSAAVRAYGIVAPAGLAARVALLPPGEDPDSLLRTRGRDAVEQVLGAALEMGRFVIRDAAQAAGDSSGRKVEAVRDLWKSMGRVRDPMLRDIYLKQMASDFGIAEDVLRKHVGLGVGSWQVNAPEVPAPEPTSVEALPDEMEMVGALLDHPELVGRRREQLDGLDLAHAGLASVLRQMLESPPGKQVEAVRAGLTYDGAEPYKRWALERLVCPRYHNAEEAEQAFDDCFRKIVKRGIEKRLPELENEIRRAIADDDQDRLASLWKEKTRLKRRAVDGEVPG